MNQIQAAAVAHADAATGSASLPTYTALMGALEKIWLSGHPDAPEHMAELRGITEAEFGNRLVRIAGETLGRL